MRRRKRKEKSLFKCGCAAPTRKRKGANLDEAMVIPTTSPLPGVVPDDSERGERYLDLEEDVMICTTSSPYSKLSRMTGRVFADFEDVEENVMYIEGNVGLCQIARMVWKQQLPSQGLIGMRNVDAEWLCNISIEQKKILRKCERRRQCWQLHCLS